MGVRRTREQKQQAQLRREEGLSFQWLGTGVRLAGETVAAQPAQKASAEGAVRSQHVPRSSRETQWLRRDLLRTATAVLSATLILAAAWWASR